MNYHHPKSNTIFIFFAITTILSIFLNYEFSVFQLDGGDERLRNSFVPGKFGKITLPNFEIQEIPLNLFDVILMTITFYVFFFKRKDFLNFAFHIVKNKYNSKLILGFLSLCLFLFISLLINYDRVSNKQFLIQLLHLLKIFEVLIFFILFVFLYKNIKYLSFLKIMIFTSILFPIGGLFGIFSEWNISNIIDNRMTYFGIILLNLSVTPFVFFRTRYMFDNVKIWNILIHLGIFLSILSCLTCGKRAIFISTFLILIISIFLIIKKIEKINKIELIISYCFPLLFLMVLNLNFF